MRLFAACELSSAVKEELGLFQKRLDPYADSLKFATPDQLHLTVKFLGETSDRLLPQIEQTLAAIASRHSKVSVSLKGCGVFPESGPPRIVWAGLEPAAAALQDLYLDAQQAFEQLGFPSETRAFAPHITLARIRRNERPNGLREKVRDFRLAPLSQPIDSLTLFSSELDGAGSRYTPLFRAELR